MHIDHMVTQDYGHLDDAALMLLHGETKKIILEALWNIVLSDKKSGIYESNLMRRVCGLIYFPDKECAEIKLKLLSKS